MAENNNNNVKNYLKIDEVIKLMSENKMCDVLHLFFLTY